MLLYKKLLLVTFGKTLLNILKTIKLMYHQYHRYILTYLSIKYSSKKDCLCEELFMKILALHKGRAVKCCASPLYTSFNQVNTPTCVTPKA